MIRYNATDAKLIRDWIYEKATVYGKRKFEKAFSINKTYLELITSPKLASHLGVAVDFVKKNARKGLVPSKKIGPYYYFEEKDISIWEEFLKSRLSDTKCKLPNREYLKTVLFQKDLFSSTEP